MAEFLHIDPEDLVEEVVEDYSYSAASVFGHVLIGMLFMALFGFIYYGRSIGESEGSGDQIDGVTGLYGLGIFMIVALGITAINWFWTDIVTKRETGSRINLVQRKVFWWDGPAPAIVHAVDVDSLVRVTFESTGDDGEDIILWDTSGANYRIPDLCVRNTRDWAKSLTSRFPHFTLGKSAPFFKFWKKAET